MTKEEAAKILEYPIYRWSLDWFERKDGLDYKEAIKKAIAALHAQQAPLDRSRWEGCEWCIGFCPEVTGDPHWNYKFCPMCGRPLTEEAWAELERRINGGTAD